jgi:hypothetical protein
VTWTKLGDEYSDEVAHAGLSDAAYRTHTEAIGWLYRIEDMRLCIPKSVVRRFAGSPDHELGIKDLAAAGYWRDRGDAWEVIHHAEIIRQSIQQQQDHRERNRRAQRAYRKRKSERPEVSADVSADVSGNTDRQSRPANHLQVPPTGKARPQRKRGRAK